MNVYETAHSGAVWRDLSHFGCFSVSGADAAHLLHHLTTNDIKGLKVGQGCDTVLVNNKARVLDLLTIWRHRRHVADHVAAAGDRVGGAAP